MSKKKENYKELLRKQTVKRKKMHRVRPILKFSTSAVSANPV